MQIFEKNKNKFLFFYATLSIYYLLRQKVSDFFITSRNLGFSVSYSQINDHTVALCSNGALNL